MCGGGATSQAAYEDKYAKGYGVRYPEGHIIRFYERILKYELGLTSGKVFDFGCGNGTHAEYFQSKGFEVYGVDIIKEAIAQAQSIMGQRAKLIEPNQSVVGLFDTQFDLVFAGFEVYGVDIIKEAIAQAQSIMGQRAKLIEPNQSVVGLFDTQFDLVFANQSLYYLDNANLRRQVDELYAMTKKGGICFFTMMSRQNGYNKCITKEFEDGLSEVTLSGRLNEQSYIRFVNDESELKAIFAPFKPLYIGEYRAFDLYEPYNSEGSSHHYMFIGQKE